MKSGEVVAVIAAAVTDILPKEPWEPPLIAAPF
jgi:hypothetical protein